MRANSLQAEELTMGNETITSFEGPIDWADYYGQRISGTIQPAESGDYTFLIASDDNSELWLSTDDNPANAAQIASVPFWTEPPRCNSVASRYSAGRNPTPWMVPRIS